MDCGSDERAVQHARQHAETTPTLLLDVQHGGLLNIEVSSNKNMVYGMGNKPGTLGDN